MDVPFITSIRPGHSFVFVTDSGHGILGKEVQTRNEGRDLQLESLKLSPTGCERFAVCLDASGCRELILCPHRATLAL